MKINFLLTSLLCLFITAEVNAKTLCSMTFNSPDEKVVFKKHLTPIGYKHIELVPENKDPSWFKKACASVKSCDILVVSGHFGGLFFGEQSSATISLNELLTAREQSLCPAILDSPKSVYLMGCNTLSSKSADHRSVNDYLRVLVGDGFPLNLAEEVAASRYLNFGQSMSEFMSSIFNQSQMLVGFESTGPLGAQAAPRLEKAFKASGSNDKNTTGLSQKALLSAFSGTNLRIIKPEMKTEDRMKAEALSLDSSVSLKAWKVILSPQNLTKHYDFIIKNETNKNLEETLKENPLIARSVHDKMIGILKSANGLSEIQVRVLRFLKHHQLINYYVFEDSLLAITSNILNRGWLDYVSADQLCSILKEHQEVDLMTKLNLAEKKKINESLYGEYLQKCAGKFIAKSNKSKVHQCLLTNQTHDWGCLTENAKNLNIESCSLAKSRNSDEENADDMMWFCYSNMNENKQLNQASCLEMTHHFSLLGNRIKMNWNCLNRVSK